MAVSNIVPVPLVEGPAAPARHLHQADPAREDPPVAVTATARARRVRVGRDDQLTR